MSSWFENDSRVLELRNKIVSLTKTFDILYGKDIKDYDKKLERFLNERLKVESDSILREQLIYTIIPLVKPNRKV